MGDLRGPSDLDHETLWNQLRLLIARLFAVLEDESDTRLDDCLDSLVDVLGADRGLILLANSDGSTRVVNARARKKTLDPVEREEISKTIVREAMQTGQCIVVDPLESANASASMTSLGIRLALAAPFTPPAASSTPRGPRGVVYVDFRDPRSSVSERRVDFFIAGTLLVGTLLEQVRRDEAVRDRLREVGRHCVEARPSPNLWDLLAPESMRAVRREVESALHGDSPMLVLGESGTGKTLLAQAIAEASGRRPIVRAVLGASDDLNTITSELFGHEKGSYSGATRRRVGLVEYANRGTLILDEVLNLSPHAQKLLLDFTQFGTYRPLGYEHPEPKRAAVRVIAATNGDLRAAVKDGRFRLDLFHRLAAVTLELPPLRDRRQDVLALAESTLRGVDPERVWSFSVALRRLLLSPSITWSGNVRQLERVILRARERALVRDPQTTTLLPEHVEPRDIDGAHAANDPGAPEPESPGVTWQRLQAERARIDDAESSVIRRALVRADGVVAHAARELGVARTTLSSRIDALGLRPSRRSLAGE